VPEYYFDHDVLESRLRCNGNTPPRIVLFLDYDGTLVPIRKDPAACFLSDEMRHKLLTLAECEKAHIAVLSGRTLDDIRRRVGVKGIFYGGNHGLDISGPGVRFIHDAAKKTMPLIARAKKMIERVVPAFEGAWIEDKKYTLSLHFRRMKSEDAAMVKRIFSRSLDEFKGNDLLHIMRGKKVLELSPNASWNKGKAALMILGLFGTNCLPLMVGDDVTDETVFQALKERGITIRVGRSGKTAAQYYLKNQGEVQKVIDGAIAKLLNT